MVAFSAAEASTILEALVGRPRGISNLPAETLFGFFELSLVLSDGAFMGAPNAHCLGAEPPAGGKLGDALDPTGLLQKGHIGRDPGGRDAKGLRDIDVAQARERVPGEQLGELKAPDDGAIPLAIYNRPLHKDLTLFNSIKVDDTCCCRNFADFFPDGPEKNKYLFFCISMTYASINRYFFRTVRSFRLFFCRPRFLGTTEGKVVAAGDQLSWKGRLRQHTLDFFR